MFGFAMIYPQNPKIIAIAMDLPVVIPLAAGAAHVAVVPLLVRM